MSNLSGQTFVDGKRPTASFFALRRRLWPVLAMLLGSTAALISPAAPALSLASVTAPNSVAAGASVSGYVALNVPAPAAGVVVTLWTSGSPAFVPSNISIAPGATRGAFKITTVQTPAAAQAIITAFYKGVRKTVALTVKPGIALISVSVPPGNVIAGNSATGTVTLSRPAPARGLTIQLWTNGSPAFVPKTVIVPAGATKAPFRITTTPAPIVTATAARSTITAFYNGASKTASFTVAPAPGLASLAAPSSIVGGDTLSGSVWFTAPAPAKGVVVNLWTSGSPAFVPSSVTIPAGRTSAVFKIRTVPASTTAHPVLTAFHSGITKTLTLTVTPPPGLSNVSIAPDKIKPGASTTGTVTLNTAAPAGGLVIDLWTSGAPASVPAHVKVPAGAASATFPVTTTAAATAQHTITAFYKGVRKTANLNVASSTTLAGTRRR